MQNFENIHSTRMIALEHLRFELTCISDIPADIPFTFTDTFESDAKLKNRR